MDAEDRLDEDFMFYLAVSERNWKNLKTEKEKQLAQDWLFKLTAVQQTKADKRDRNLYLSQLALAICDGELGLPFARRPPEGVLPAASQVFGPPQPLIEVPPEFRKIDKSGDLTTAYTSKDGRTYVATKSLGKDYGAYTYIGISLADTEPLWVGSDTLTGPCYGFERHFQKPQTLYSKPRPRPRSTLFTMEKDGGSGDSLDDTRIFTDYVTGAKAAQMSGTHAEDSQPSVRKSLRRSSVGVLDKSFRLSMPEIPGKDVRRSIEGPRKSLRLSGMHDKDFRGSVGVLDTSFRLPAEKIAGIPVQSPRKSLKGLDTLEDLTEEEDEDADKEEEEDDDEDESFPTSLQRLSMDTTLESQIDVSEFYTQMIRNLDNSLSGKEDLNEYNKEKVDEIQHNHEKEMQLVDAAEKTREALLKKLKRVKEEESRVSEKIKKLEIMLLISSSGTDDSVIETWKEACKFHDEKNLQLLEEVYNQSVRERVAEMMTNLKLNAVHVRGKHMKAQAAAAIEDFKHQSEKIQAKIQAADDLVDRIQTVLGQMVDLKSAGPREDLHLDQKRELAEQLQADVEQLTNIYNEWLFKLTALQPTKADKRDRNVYLSQLALAMAEGELNGPFLKRPPEGTLPAPSEVFGPKQPRIEVPPEFTKVDRTDDLTTRYTSKDGRTYVATKSLGKNHGAYTYIGISLAETEPLWVGGDMPSGPCYGFERHFEKPQTLYSKPRPRPSSTVFTMEKEGGAGDSPEDTRVFTDYVTGAKSAQMSGTHGKDFQPSVEMEKRLKLPDPSQTSEKEGGAGQRKSSTAAPIKSEESAKKAQSEKDKPPSPNPWEGLDIMFPLPKEGVTTKKNAQLDISVFYKTMITNVNNTMSGKEELNEYNKEKADEIKERYDRANNQLQTLEVLNRTKEALVKKLIRVKDAEISLSEKIKNLEFELLSKTTDSEDSVFDIAWKEACKVHDAKNLQLLEDTYGPEVKDRVASMMIVLKSRAVYDRSKHMKAQVAAVRDDFKLQTEKIQAKLKVAEDTMNRIQGVMDEAMYLKPSEPVDDPCLEQRRRLAERLLEDVEQLTNMYNIEYDTCRSIEREIAKTSGNIFSHPEFTRLSMDNRRLKSGITVMQTHLRRR